MTRAGTATQWWVAAAEATGAHHLARGMVYEDALAISPDDGRDTEQSDLVVAIADGHGHARHFRSAKGSRLAVDIATATGRAVAGDLAAQSDARKADAYLRGRVGPEIIRTWREAVATDLRDEPVRDDEFTAAGLAHDAGFDELIYGYGATLLVAIAAGRWLLCMQLGDGDLFLVGPSGTVTKPMPIDPRLDGLRTTSLCQPDAAESMRYAVMDTAKRDVAAVMLATDGYGNAQVRNDWENAFGADLAALATEHGPRWIGGQLPTWVNRCASAEGSGDDVTAALMFAAGKMWQMPPGAMGLDTIPNVAAERTAHLPAPGAGIAPEVAAAATVPSGPAPERAAPASPLATDRTVLVPPAARRPSPGPSGMPPPPAKSRRGMLLLLIGAIVLVAVAVVVVILVASGGSTPKPHPTKSTPTSTPTNTAPVGPGKVGSPGVTPSSQGPFGGSPTFTGPATPTNRESVGANS
jgi:hypothetical protein